MFPSITPPSSQTPPLAVVILNWNGAKLLEQYLPSVLTHTPREWAEVIVVDNGSTDHSLQVLEQKFPQVKVLKWSNNLGYAGGYNRAVSLLPHSYFCLLNSDVEVRSDLWIQRPLQLMMQEAQVAAVQPKLLAWKAPDMFEYAGAAGGYLDALGYPYCRGRIFDSIEKDIGQYDTETDIDWASGAALFIRKDVFLEVGGFDETFFAHMEEIDLCWRLRRKGYQVKYTPQSVVWHLGGASLTATNPQKTFLNFRNNRLMLKKNLPPQKHIGLSLLRTALDLLSALLFLLSKRPRHARAVLQALRAYHKMAARYPYEAQDVRALLPNGKAPKRIGSVVWRYYILGRKTYSQL